MDHSDVNKKTKPIIITGIYTVEEEHL